MRILIVGDSFSANALGWPSMIGHDIVIKAQNGVGEYKIFKQLENVEEYDKVLVCHTSPWRLHTKFHPIHDANIERPNCDFLLSDVEYHAKNNKEMKLVYSYMKKYMDLEYQKFIYNCIVDKLLEIDNAINFTFHNKEDTKEILINFYDIWQNNKGNINHMNIKGNELVAEEIKKLLQC